MKLTLEAINQAIAVLFFVCYAYQFVYIPVALLRRRKHLPAAAPHRFAVLIAARNEETVIGDLLDSLHAQDYDMSLITVFVIADNCTDRTAAIASEKGAVVYTRQNKQAVGKGYALEALLAHIKSDYPDGYDAYLVFDADNLLAPDFLTRMNESFSAGNEIITCYRNSKNYGSNWISAGYALWFLRESRFLNGAREALGSSCAVSGTGFLFLQKILNECGGWPFHLLVEDIEFSIHNILSGHRIAICQDAVIYDEQPTDFAQSCRQRLRWSRGYLQVFGRYGSGLLRGAARGNWSCVDMSMAIMPAIVLTSISSWTALPWRYWVSLAVPVCCLHCSLWAGRCSVCTSCSLPSVSSPPSPNGTRLTLPSPARYSPSLLSPSSCLPISRSALRRSLSRWNGNPSTTPSPPRNWAAAKAFCGISLVRRRKNAYHRGEKK